MITKCKPYISLFFSVILTVRVVQVYTSFHDYSFVYLLKILTNEFSIFKKTHQDNIHLRKNIYAFTSLQLLFQREALFVGHND